MSQALCDLYIPPYSGVRLVECRDHFQLVPVPAVRTIYGYGKIKSCEAVDPDDKAAGPIWPSLAPDVEVWAVMQWYRYADGFQMPGNICFLKPECPEEQVRRRMEQMQQSADMTREEAVGILKCYDASEEDHEYVDENYPNYQTEPDPKAADDYDVCGGLYFNLPCY